MSESLESNNKDRRLTRREFLTGATALGATAATNTEAPAGFLDWLLREPVGRLKHRYHAAEQYMDHDQGQLRVNYERFRALQKAVRGGAYKHLPDRQRSSAIDADIKPIVDEKNALLAEFDKKLIPQLLVTYVQRDVMDKSLVEVYTELGGNIEAIRSKGIPGLDQTIIEKIRSIMEYRLMAGRYSPLSFHVKRRPEDDK